MIDLRVARFHRGLDLAGAAEQFGISASYLSLIERRKAIPRGPIAKCIADFYGYAVVDIWPVVTDEPSGAAA